MSTPVRKSEKRKKCHDCGKLYSGRHFRQHVEDGVCKKSTSTTDDSSSPTDSDSDERRDSAWQGLMKKFSAEAQQLQHEDSIFFDEAQSNNQADVGSDGHQSYMSGISSGSRSESNSDNNSDVEMESDLDVILRNICSFLLVWQSKHKIPDRSLDHLLKFLMAVFVLLGVMSLPCMFMAENLPTSVKTMRDLYSNNKTSYVRYVVCIKCAHLYDYNDCFQKVEGRLCSKMCSHVEFPNHPYRKNRQPCGQPLLKVVKDDIDKDPKLEPFKVYYYQKLKSALQRFVRRPDFENLCEKWRTRETVEGYLADVYDGRVWAEFSDPSGYDFFSHPNNYGLMLNVDWFQPFDHVQYSVGAIYLVCLNLPIEERYKPENVVLVGLIPHFTHEPSTNTFLKPLVDELNEAWEQGFELCSYLSQETPKRFRLALILCGCDIPAGRKVCGFLGCMANLGCSKCLKFFPGDFGKKCFGGFDRENWVPRDNDSHREKVALTQAAKHQSGRDGLESEYGLRYSVLLLLPYWNPVRMLVVDPMHNFFLGTTKSYMQLLKERNKIKQEHLDLIQKRLDMIESPSDMGNIPHKVSSNFSGLTADQLKNWTLMFSMYCLRDILPKKDLVCWQKFALACKWLCSKVLKKSNVTVGDNMLHSFCKEFESLYGASAVKPNMHLHCHVAECILDYGPMYNFWLFSFERYNGLLGEYTTNQKNIEPQLFCRFVTTLHKSEIEGYDKCGKDLESVFDELYKSSSQRGSLLRQSKPLSSVDFVCMSTPACVIKQKNWELPQSYVETIKCSKERDGFNEPEMGYITGMYRHLYGDIVDEASFTVCISYRKANRIDFMGHVLGSCEGRSVRSAWISAHWCNAEGNVHAQREMCEPARPGQVETFVVHKVIVNGRERMHVLAKVLWHAGLSQHRKQEVGDLNPVEVWSDMQVDPGSAMFMPIQRVKCKVVQSVDEVKEKKVMFVCPRHQYLVCE